jgi:hypothetical protein
MRGAAVAAGLGFEGMIYETGFLRFSWFLLRLN